MTAALKNPPYGADTYADASGVRYGTVVTDPGLLVAQAMARRFNTPKGKLRSDPNYGECLVEWLMKNDPNNANTLALQQSLRGEALKDERIEDVDFVATSSFADSSGAKRLDVQVSGTLDDGSSTPFQFALAVTDVTVELIFQASTSNS